MIYPADGPIHFLVTGTESLPAIVFVKVNPTWANTAYLIHLYQDCAWDNWIREMVDVSERLKDKFIYILIQLQWRKEIFFFPITNC